jgi:hypothetical protein
MKNMERRDLDIRIMVARIPRIDICACSEYLSIPMNLSTKVTRFPV